MNEPRGRRRARRYPLVASALVRPCGQPEWHAATTLNISRTGVLFRESGPPTEPGVSVEFILTMPRLLLRSRPAVLCTGEVVRVHWPSHSGFGCAVAAAIDRCRVVSGPEPRRSRGTAPATPHGT